MATPTPKKLTVLEGMLGEKGKPMLDKLTGFMTDATEKARKVGLTSKEKKVVSTKDEYDEVEEVEEVVEEETEDEGMTEDELADLAEFIGVVVAEVTAPMFAKYDAAMQEKEVSEKERGDELTAVKKELATAQKELAAATKAIRVLNGDQPRSFETRRASQQEETELDEEDEKEFDLPGDVESVDDFITTKFFGQTPEAA